MTDIVLSIVAVFQLILLYQQYKLSKLVLAKTTKMPMESIDKALSWWKSKFSGPANFLDLDPNQKQE